MTGFRQHIAIIILAAGQSRRMGPANKLLMPWRGKPVLRHVAEAALAARVGQVLVITGHDAASVEQALGGLALSFVCNRDHELGMSTSLKAGLSALPPDVLGAVVMLGDMPGVPVGVLNRLMDAFSENQERICIPVCGGKRGNPVLLPRWMFAALQDLEGDRGARDVITRHSEQVMDVAVETTAIHRDIDTPDDVTGG